MDLFKSPSYFTRNLGQILQILLRQKSEYGDRGLKSSLGAERRMGRVPAMDYCCGSLVTRCTASDLSGRLPVLAVGVLRPHTRANPSVVNAGRGWSWALSVLEPNALTLIAGLILAALSLQGINSPDPLGWVYSYKGNGYICNWWRAVQSVLGTSTMAERFYLMTWNNQGRISDQIFGSHTDISPHLAAICVGDDRVEGVVKRENRIVVPGHYMSG